MLEATFSNPFRVPHWRWLRAAGYLDGRQRRPTKKRDGAEGYRWIKRAANFQHAYNACDGDGDMIELAETYPDIFWAHHAYRERGGNPMGYQIEAHILARDSDFQVGYHAGLSPKLVEAYEALFFNVRDRLDHQGYILHQVMGPAIQRGLSEREYDLLWKLYGYFCGPHMLLALINKFPNPGWCSTPDTINSVVQDDAINTLKLKAALAAKIVSVNQHTSLSLLDTFTKFIEVERTTDTAGKAENQILDHINAMMTNLPFTVGGRTPPKVNNARANSRVMTLRQSAVELSFEESMAVAAGQPIENEDMILQLGAVDPDGNSLAFPPPVRRDPNQQGAPT